MAEGDAIVTNQFKTLVLKKVIDCVNDTFKLALYSVALNSPDGSPVYAVLNEISPANYVAGGQSIGVPTVTQDDAGNLAKWDDDGTDVSWASLGAATIREARLYDDTVAAPVAKPVCILWAISTDSNGGNYGLVFNAAGMMTLA